MKIKTFIEAVCMLLIVVLICALVVNAISEPDYDFEETTYEVQSGDCLWNIASEYCPQSMNKWDYIKLVMERNHLTDSVIHPGQHLVVFQSRS